MNIKQKLEWCERACGGRKIDMLIGETLDPTLESKCEFYQADLASNNRDWRHDRDKLMKAIIAQFD